MIGTRVSMIALPFFVLTTTGSPEKTGLVALAEMLPLVLLKVLGGPIIDRVGARRVAITCDWASLAVVGAIPFLHDAGLLSFPGFLGLVAVAGALRGPGDAAKTAMTPDPRGHRRRPDGAGHRAQLDGGAHRRRCSAPRSPAAWSPPSGRPTR